MLTEQLLTPFSGNTREIEESLTQLSFFPAFSRGSFCGRLAYKVLTAHSSKRNDLD
jgi:hypothetical protein